MTTSGRATLKLGGHAVASLKAGKYDVVVDDEAARAGFFVQHGTHKAVAADGRGVRRQPDEAPCCFSAGKWSFFARPGSKVQFTVVA